MSLCPLPLSGKCPAPSTEPLPTSGPDPPASPHALCSQYSSAAGARLQRVLVCSGCSSAAGTCLQRVLICSRYSSAPVPGPRRPLCCAVSAPLQLLLQTLSARSSPTSPVSAPISLGSPRPPAAPMVLEPCYSICHPPPRLCNVLFMCQSRLPARTFVLKCRDRVSLLFMSTCPGLDLVHRKGPPCREHFLHSPPAVSVKEVVYFHLTEVETEA